MSNDKTVTNDGGIDPETGQLRSQAARVPEADPLIGRMIGSYKISKLLGKGGMGAVYAAQHPAIGSQVAIKFLHEQYAQDKGIVTRFFNEAKAVNLINHDNIVRVTDYSYLDEKMPYFVMEILGKGYELNRFSKVATGLDVIGPIMIQACDALAAAHSNNIIHRDLKPDNIYLTERSGRKHFVKLMDFGIAKLAGNNDEQGQTKTGMVMGTPHYMSPEQASGLKTIDARSDIYSLGIIMYQLATGQLPFKGDSFAQTLIAHIAQAPQPPRELNPAIPEAYENIILKCIAKAPDDRFQSMRELGTEIISVMRQLGIPNELPVADGVSPSDAAPFSPTMAGNTTARTNPNAGGVNTNPNQTKMGMQSGSGGTLALTAEQAAALAQQEKGMPFAQRAMVWGGAFLVGFVLIVGLNRAGVIKQELPQPPAAEVTTQ